MAANEHPSTEHAEVGHPALRFAPGQGPFALAPEEEHLAGWTIDGQRRWIEPIVSRGRFLNLRVAVAVGLLIAFFALPHVSIAGKPAILLDLSTRQFTFFGLTLHPTDNLVLLALGGAIVVSVFFFTAVFGRIWCGYACPQTVYMEFVFRPIETLVEGKPATRRKRDAGPWTTERALRKAAKWGLYLVIAVLMARTFVSYFMSWDHLWPVGGTFAEQMGVNVATLVTTALIIVDFAFFREQMCATACPYGRLQSVLFDQDTLIVAYDEKRGEPRAKGKAREQTAAGDCVDCSRCVTTCPTGIDIRRGLQLECVGCAQCIDACDDVMVRIGKPKGLVRYASSREMKGEGRKFLRPRLFIYFAILCVGWGALIYLLSSRAPAQIALFKGSNEPFKMVAGDRVQNQLRLRVTNHEHAEHTFTVTIREPAGAELSVSANPFRVPGDEVATETLTIRSPASVFKSGRVTAKLVVKSDSGYEAEREMLLLGPDGQ